jgi:hypothetical protein
MNIVKLTDENAIQMMQESVQRSLDDPAVRVFQILGRFGIGKRTAIRSLLNDRAIDPVEHNYTVIENGKPIADKVAAHPDAIHIWDDIFRSNIMHPEVLSVLRGVQDGTIQFHGTFLLVANDQEFTDQIFPPFPGVHVEFEDPMMLLKSLERRMLEKGMPEEYVQRSLQNTMRWMMEKKETGDR